MSRKLLRTFGQAGNTQGFPATMFGISQLFDGSVEVQAEQSIHDFANAVEQSHDMHMIIDCAGVIQYVNAAFELVTGFSKAEVTGRTLATLRADLQQADYYDALWNSLLAGHTFRGVLVNRKRNGEIFHEEKSISPIRDAAGNTMHFFATGRDVTQRENELEHLQRLANYDSLTGLPNRNLFMDRFQHALSRATRGNKQIALFYLDLDHFKQVNDTLGHAAGDELLQLVALRLKQCMREEDTVARLCGDEFAMIQVDVGGLDSVRKVLDKIFVSFRQSFQCGGQPLTESISIGVSIYPRDGSEVSDLLQCADIAMYRSKTTGGNRYLFYCDVCDEIGNPEDALARRGKMLAPGSRSRSGG